MSRDDDTHERVPIKLTRKQREHIGRLGQDRFKDSTFQRWAQSHRSRESLAQAGKAGWRAMFQVHGRQALVDAGKLGWAATVAKYGEEYAWDRLADRRRNHPSGPEQQMIALLAELGQHKDEEYVREHKVAPRLHVDFAWPANRRAIEINGGVHFGPFFDPDGARSVHDAAREARIRDQGWELLVVTSRELRRSQWEATRLRVERFVTPQPAPGEDRRWLTATRETLEQIRRALHDRRAWRVGQ